MFKNSKEATANTNHKNRKYSILLLALLFIGVATYGTYAYFTDSKSIDGQLTLMKGQVSLGDVEDQNWTYQGNSGSTGTISDESFLEYNANLSNGEENATSTNSLKGTSFSNVLPGDTFTTAIDVKYTGSVDAEGDVKVDTEKLPEGLNYKISVDEESITSADGYSKDISFKGDSADDAESRIVKIVLTVQVPYNENAEDFNTTGTSRNDGNGKNFLEQLQDAITVTVDQQLTSTKSSN